MRPLAVLVCVAALAAVTLSAQSTPTLPAEALLDRTVLKALDEELSGVAAKGQVGRLTQSAVKGPLAPNGDWVREKGGAGASSIAIARVPNSDDVTDEIVNFIDGTRTVSDIRDAVSAEFEPLELKAVAEYLDLIARTGAASFKR